MNLLDFEIEFETRITFEGDNETDTNDLTIKRHFWDIEGKEIEAVEQYNGLSSESLRSIAIGLEAMAKQIRDFMGDNY